jgi:hypothetical protein
LGPWFAAKNSASIATPGAHFRRLVTIPAACGWLARLPVHALFFLDRKFRWGRHRGAMPPDAPEAFWKQALMVTRAQFIFWPLAWTVIVGTAAGAIVFVRRRALVAA